MPAMSRRDLIMYGGLGLGAVALGGGGGALAIRATQPAPAAPSEEAPTSGHGTLPKSGGTSKATGLPHGDAPVTIADTHGADSPSATPGADTHGAATPGAASHDAEALLLSCMDFRLMDQVSAFMAREGLTHQYDHVILAGASLVPATDAFPEWNAAFWKHLELALQLHRIRRVVVLDHRDCGAYKLVLGPDVVRDRPTETQTHSRYLTQLRADIRAEYPTLRVDLLIMDLDGTVERVT
jgi:hypothetical protein